MSNNEILDKFYNAFSKGDWKTMNSLYRKDVLFSDAIFSDINYEQVTGMWKMLLSNNKNMSIEYTILDSVNGVDRVNWIAKYTFGPKKRKVTNNVIAEIKVVDSKIVSHKDVYSFKKWAKQSIGMPARLFGSRKWFQRKVKGAAFDKLSNFIEAEKKIEILLNEKHQHN